MNLRQLSRAEVDRDWPAIRAALEPAVDQDPKFDWWDFQYATQAGRVVVSRIEDGPTGYVASLMGKGGVFWLLYVGGAGWGRRTLKAALGLVEAEARRMGARLMRIEGRDWRPILRGWRAKQGKDGRWRFKRRLVEGDCGCMGTVN